MQKENDTLLVAKLREGNKFAFEALYEKYSARLYNTIVLLLYDKSLAKDITQSSFMTIWEKRSNLDTEKSFPAYLCTIARNMVYKETERRLLHNKFVENKLKTEVVNACTQGDSGCEYYISGISSHNSGVLGFLA